MRKKAGVIVEFLGQVRYRKVGTNEPLSRF